MENKLKTSSVFFFFSLQEQMISLLLTVAQILNKNGRHNHLACDRAKSTKTYKFSKITNWVQLKNKQHHSKVLLNSFPMNGHSLGFCP